MIKKENSRDESATELERAALHAEKQAKHRIKSSVIEKTGRIVKPRRPSHRRPLQEMRVRLRDEKRKFQRAGKWKKKAVEIGRRLGDWAIGYRGEYLKGFWDVAAVLNKEKPGTIEYARDLGNRLSKWRRKLMQKEIESCPRRILKDHRCRVKRDGAMCHIDPQLRCYRQKGRKIYKDFLSDLGLSQSKARDYVRLWKTFEQHLEYFAGLKHFQLLMLEEYVRRQSESKDRDDVLKQLRKRKTELQGMSRERLRTFLFPERSGVTERSVQISIGQRVVIDVSKAKSGKSVKLSWPYKDASLQDEIVSFLVIALNGALTERSALESSP